MPSSRSLSTRYHPNGNDDGRRFQVVCIRLWQLRGYARLWRCGHRFAFHGWSDRLRRAACLWLANLGIERVEIGTNSHCLCAPTHPPESVNILAYIVPQFALIGGVNGILVGIMVHQKLFNHLEAPTHNALEHGGEVRPSRQTRLVYPSHGLFLYISQFRLIIHQPYSFGCGEVLRLISLLRYLCPIWYVTSEAGMRVTCSY